MSRTIPSRFNIILYLTITVAITILPLFGGVFAARDAHLLPVGPFFDTQGEYARQYADICEKILFPSLDWEVRYYEVIANPSATTGITVYRQGGGREDYIEVRQVTPELKSVIQSTDYESGNLEAISGRIKTEKAKMPIPTSTASEIRELWLWYLSDVAPLTQEGDAIFIHAPLVILYAKKEDGTLLAGKLPPNHQAVAKLVSLRSIVADLISACDASDADRERLFAKIERASQKLRGVGKR